MPAAAPAFPFAVFVSASQKEHGYLVKQELDPGNVSGGSPLLPLAPSITS
jgi:hypothetical protein